MKKIFIISSGYLNNDLSISIGGIQTYISMLVQSFSETWDIFIIQRSTKTFNVFLNNANIVGVSNGSPRDLLNEAYRIGVDEQDIILFSTDQYYCPSSHDKTIVIQHGIGWDLPTNLITSRVLPNMFETAYRFALCYRNLRRVRSAKTVVCVDYNYPNWFYTLANRKDRLINFEVIPNCSSISAPADRIEKPTKTRRVTFARRFVSIRGFDIFLDAAKQLVLSYEDVEVLFCGDGDSRSINKLISLTRDFSAIKWMKVPQSEMADIYRSSDIVVIPSLGSEGTSLTAVEAMCCGVAIVATSVGGVTNIIIDGYNGLFCEKNATSLTEKIRYLIDNESARHDLAKNGRDVSAVFSYENWSFRWKKILDDI
jgi:glycosyltransferase involved in cell wall biosynthesis